MKTVGDKKFELVMSYLKYQMMYREWELVAPFLIKSIITKEYIFKSPYFQKPLSIELLL